MTVVLVTWADGGKRKMITEEKANGDEYDAMRVVVGALEKFSVPDRQRILRYVSEKLDLAAAPAAPASPHGDVLQEASAASAGTGALTDIKTFIERKSPTSDAQFTAAVAYYYRFEAPQSARKDSINADDLQDACRKVGRHRFRRPAQTLVNAHSQGLLDKSGDRGSYTLSTVGENLVAVALPASGTPAPARNRSKRNVRGTAKRKARKAR